MKIYSIKFMVLLFVSTVSLADSSVAQNLGEGWNSSADEYLGNCLDFKPISRESDLEGSVESSFRTGNFELHWIENRSQLREALDLDASAYIKAGLGRGSAKAAVALSTVVSKYSLNFVLQVNVTAKPLTIEDATIKSTVPRKNPSAFLAQCGNEFVSEVERGGALIVTVQVNTNSEREKERVRASVSGRYTSGGFNASTAKDFESLFEGRQYSISIYQIGGGDVRPIENGTIADFFDYYNTAVANILINPAPIRVKTKRYRSIDGTLDIKSSIEQRRALRDATREYEQLLSRYDDIQYIIENFERFEKFSVDEMIESQREARSLLDGLLYFYEDCAADHSFCANSELEDISESADNINKTVLPEILPLYSLLEMRDPNPPSTHQSDFGKDCKRWYNTRHQSEDLTVSPEVGKFSYRYTCYRTNYTYSCGGDKKDLQFQNNKDVFHGMVTGDVAVDNGLLTVGNMNIVREGKQPKGCVAPLVRHLESLNGTVVAWEPADQSVQPEIKQELDR